MQSNKSLILDLQQQIDRIVVEQESTRQEIKELYAKLAPDLAELSDLLALDASLTQEVGRRRSTIERLKQDDYLHHVSVLVFEGRAII